MTNKQRLLAVLNGEKPDRVPFIPRIKLWYKFHNRNDSLPDRYQGCSIRDIEDDIKVGTPAREGKIFDVRFSGNVKIQKKKKGSMVVTQYITPVGKLTKKEKSSLEEYSLEPVEYLIESGKDYSIMKYLIEHLSFVPTYKEYLSYEKQIGESGLPLVLVGLWPPNEESVGVHCPIHDILRRFLGYESGYLHLMSKHTQKVQNLLEIYSQKAKEMQRVVLNSPAKFILHGAHFDRQMTPPHIFKKFFLPYFRDFSKKLHFKGMKLACHLDSETKELYQLIEEAGFDVADCFTTVPLVQYTNLAEAREKWEDSMIIWGGVPSTILEPGYDHRSFLRHMYNLFKTIVPGDNFILGIADNLMPSSEFDRVIEISKMVEALGSFPINEEAVECYFVSNHDIHN